MPDDPQQTGTPGEKYALYQEKADLLIDRYEALVHYVGQLSFPASRYPIFYLYEKPGWPNWRKRISKISNPFEQLNVQSTGNDLTWVFPAWLLACIGWVIMWLTMMLLLFSEKQQTTAPASSSWLAYILFTILLSSALFSPFAYIFTVDYLRDKRNLWSWRVIWTLISLGWLIAFLLKMKEWYPATFPVVLASSPGHLTLAVLTLLFYMIPTLIFFAMLIVFGIRLASWLYTFLLTSSMTIHNPSASRNIRKIVKEKIDYKEMAWWFADLDRFEIRQIRQWARDNLDSTEKRTLPTTIILGFIAFLSTTSVFQNWLNGWVTFFTGEFSKLAQATTLDHPLEMIALFIVLFPLLIFILLTAISYLLIFANIVVQSLIIEACTVAEYAVQRAQETQEAVPARPFRWWDIFFKRPGQNNKS